MADFYKYHALGNDYIILDPKKTKINLTPNNIKLICDRHLGIGSDGILYGPIHDKDMIALRIFNSDGSEAEKSGNGIRIFAKFLIDYGYIKKRRDLELRTLGGNVFVELLNEDNNLIKVNMGTRRGIYECFW